MSLDIGTSGRESELPPHSQHERARLRRGAPAHILCR